VKRGVIFFLTSFLAITATSGCVGDLSRGYYARTERMINKDNVTYIRISSLKENVERDFFKSLKHLEFVQPLEKLKTTEGACKIYIAKKDLFRPPFEKDGSFFYVFNKDKKLVFTASVPTNGYTIGYLDKASCNNHFFVYNNCWRSRRYEIKGSATSIIIEDALELGYPNSAYFSVASNVPMLEFKEKCKNLEKVIKKESIAYKHL